MNKYIRLLLLLFALGFVVACDQASDSTAGGESTGQGGSMARFAITGNNLYAVTNQDLLVLDVSNADKPFEVGSLPVGFGIETIFPFKDYLFIGSQQGMFIYDNSNPDRPKRKSEFTHIRSCDPVVVRDTLAFVTLRGGTRCGGSNNQLDILNIKDVEDPELIATFPMTNPYGLGIDSNKLFICDGSDGLKIYDVEDPKDIFRIAHYPDFNANDVIPRQGVLIMIGTDGLYQYDYTVQGKPKLLSKIEVKQTLH
jgi:hypothetical protein